MEDFERIINNSHQVNFFSLSGDDITTNRLPKDAESIEKVKDILVQDLDIENFCYNIYERNQQERFKAYMFITEPNKSKLGDNISN